MNEVAKRADMETAASTPMQLIEMALDKGHGLDQLDKLMDMQERWERNQGRKQFDAAISAAKAEIPVIHKNRTGHNNKRYADFAAIAKVVDPVLSKHGLSYRFRTSQNEGQIHVACILSHEAGHSEETTLAGPADSSGSKNNIQAIGSTLTYLQRYSLVQMLGLAVSEDDDGGAAGAGALISDDEAEELKALANEVGASLPAFFKYMSAGARMEISKFGDIPKRLLPDAKSALEKKRQKEGAS